MNLPAAGSAQPLSPVATPLPAAVDANGWPIGYWESVAGCLAGEEWEPSDDPPPEPCQEP